MAFLLKKTYTKPIPPGAEFFTKSGQQWARWVDHRGKKQTARVTTGEDGQPRLYRESATWYVKYRDGSNHLVTRSTGCTLKSAAQMVMNEFVAEAERIRAGVLTAHELSEVDHRRAPLRKHLDAYIAALSERRGKGGKRNVSSHHVANVKSHLNRIVAHCDWNTLDDLDANDLSVWVKDAQADLAPRTINAGMAAMTAFVNWLIQDGRLSSNPLRTVAKLDESSDQRRVRRSLNAGEITRLLEAALLCPLAEYGRPTQLNKDSNTRANKKSRKTWKKVPLTPKNLMLSAARARLGPNEGGPKWRPPESGPHRVRELERIGFGHALALKCMLLTGLRRGEAASLTFDDLELDGRHPFARLAATNAKNGIAADIPLRADLASDLRRWGSWLLSDLQDRARAKGAPLPAALPRGTKIFDLPGDFIRKLDRMLKAAGITKVDDRGRTIDVHALRTTFNSLLAGAGVPLITRGVLMRHAAKGITDQHYFDRTVVDPWGALDLLPPMPLSPSNDGGDRLRATGTDDRALAPMLAPAGAFSSDMQPSSAASGQSTASKGLNVSAAPASSSGSQQQGNEKRANGVEPSTFSLEG